jgi:FdhD protein
MTISDVYLPDPSLKRASEERSDIVSLTGARSRWISDTFAVEEPLEIRFAGCSLAVTMRTPGDDLDLAAGFLLTEGIIKGLDDIASIGHCPADDADSAANIVNVNPADPRGVNPGDWQRNVYTTSSCGICGRASIDRVRQAAPPVVSGLRLTPADVYDLSKHLGEAQHVFSLTGGLHAAALFDSRGGLLVAREDVGRHNAVDKVIGRQLRQGRLPLTDTILLVSSRASFEIVQKALIAGIPVVAAVSAASSLAVDLARESGITLIGFLRGERFNVYAGAERIARGEGDVRER